MVTESDEGIRKAERIRPAVKYKTPLISSGADKGRVRDPLTARLLADAMEKEARTEAKKKPRSLVEKGRYVGDYLENKELSVAVLDSTHAHTVDIQRMQLDLMTGLIRKEYFDSELEMMCSEARDERGGFGFARLDLDFFSWINDALKAHVMGDLYLEEMGFLIRSSIKSSKGDLAFRLGGDEAGVLLNRKLTPVGFLAAVARLHKVLNGDKDNPTPILKRTLEKALNSTSEKKTKMGKNEREGTIALKQFLWGLYCIKNNIVVDGVGTRDDFTKNVRGSVEIKDEFLKRLDQLQIDDFKDYIASSKVYSELNEAEKVDRAEIEKKVVEVIMHAFSNMSASIAGVYVDSGDREIDADAVHAFVDEQVYGVKSKARGGLVVVDTHGNPIEDRRHRRRDLPEAGREGVK